MRLKESKDHAATGYACELLPFIYCKTYAKYRVVLLVSGLMQPRRILQRS